MKKFYRISILIFTLILLTTYSPSKFNINLKNDKKSFFSVKNIIIKNNFLIKEKEIEKKLNFVFNKNIFYLQKKEIKNSLVAIDFLDKVEVNKKFPSTIIVTIFETKPIAKLIKNKKKYLLDSSSNLILINKDLKVDKLPNIFGEIAENNFVIFLDKLKSNNFPLKKIKNFYFFQIGRWDLELNNKKVIKLPNNKIDEAIKKSVKLLNRNDFNKYYIIDLRVDGKVIVE